MARSLHLRSLLIVAFVLSAITAVLGPIAFSLPAISGGSPFGVIELVAVLPLAIPILVGWACDSAFPEFFETSVRRVEPRLLLLVSLVILSYILGAVSTMLIPGSSFPDQSIRNMALYLSIFFFSTSFVGFRLATLSPVIFMLVAVLFGRTASGPQPWALPLVFESTPRLLLISGALLLLGAASFTSLGVSRRFS